MDPVLAQIYGTNSEASDLEKLASAQMAEELAEEGMNIDGASDDQIEAMAQAVLDGIQGEEPGSEDVDQETMAKVAEADKLGRVMAHSMWQELGQIKEAAGRPVIRAVMRGANARQAARVEAAKPLRQKATEALENLSKKVKDSRFGQHVEAHKVGYGRAAKAGALLAAEEAGRKIGKGGKSKKSSALDTLAEARALEILEANGIDPSTLEPMQEKQASDPTEQLQTAVEQRAWDILAQYGLEPAGE